MMRYSKIISIITAAGLLFMTGCSSVNKTALSGNIGKIRKIKNSAFSSRKIVQLSSNIAINKIKNNIPGVRVIKLQNGRYVIISDQLNESQLQNRLNKLIQDGKIENPVTISLTKPLVRQRLKQRNNNLNTALPDDRAVNDPYYKYEWDISATESNKAWPLINQKKEIKVAVVDTGIDYNNPDLKNRILTNLGYNFINETNNASDDNGHGTHVSGIIAAEANNNIGIAGIVGQLDVKIIPVKVLDQNGEGTSDTIARGIKYAADAGADVINLSVGGPGRNQDIDNAINYARDKGVFVVAAAGNEDRNCDNYSPAGDKGAFTVAALGLNYKKANFSNFGTSIKVAAPGVKILSTVPGGYEMWDGTSMAAPIVSGIAAMIKADNPNLSTNSIQNILEKSAQDIKPRGKDINTGYGMIDAYRALKLEKSINQ